MCGTTPMTELSLPLLSGLLWYGFSSRETDQMVDPFCAIFVGLPKIVQKKNIEAGNESFCR
jgi:hypothetical protein